MKCWWCCHDWDDEFLHLPFRYHEKQKSFETMGYFCSWGCMKAFNVDSHGTSQLGSIFGINISLMKKHMYGHTKPIKAAPSRWSLQIFGGNLDIDEFRKCSTCVNEDEQLKTILPYNRELIREVVNKIEKTKPHVPSDNQLQGKFERITGSTNKNEPLKIKRTKPLKRDESNLETTLGIVRRRK
jgi:hypothetical protein